MVDARQSPPSSPLEPREQANGAERKDRSAKKPTQNDRSAASRVDIDVPLNRLHEVLQDKWSTYQQILSEFLAGRLTRLEFEQQLQPMMEKAKGFVRLHNDIMMSLLSNSFRDPPPTGAQSLGWSKARRDPTSVPRAKGDPTAKRLKTEVMGLSHRERKRIKSVPKPDPSQKLRPNSMIETRFAKLPRVPMSAQKINSSQHHNDIIKGFHAPLCSESQHLPEPESLKDRILATALENGLLGGVQAQVPDLLINGLEIHLRNILTLTLAKLRKNRVDTISLDSNKQLPAPSSSNVPLTVLSPSSQSTRRPSAVVKEEHSVMQPHELNFSYQIAPYLYIEPSHSITRLAATLLDDSTPADKEWSTIEQEETKTLGAVSQRVQVAMMLDSFLSLS